MNMHTPTQLPVQLALRCSRRSAGLVLLALLSSLPACSFFSGPKTTSVAQIKVVAEINANQSSATQIDIVFVYDSTAAALLPKTGPEWFDKKAALLAGAADSIDVASLQVPPATIAEVSLPGRHGKAIGVYVFANYLSPAGQAVSNITPYKRVTIWLTPSSISYKFP